MLEVVFSDSAKASMMMAKRYNDINMMDGPTGYIGKKPSKREIKKQNEGKAIGGSSEDVVYIGFSLDVGDISGEIDDLKRQEVFHNVWNSVNFNEEETERFFNDQREDLEKLLSAAKKGEPIRIWKGNSPFSACGFAFTCYVLRNIDCKISVISLPEYRETSNNTIEYYTNWGEIAPGQLYSFLSYEQELSDMEKHIQSNLWKDLKRENEPLRAIVNDKLISVPEDFYDHLILKNIPNKEFVMSQLIGEILCKYELGVGDGWYALRIKNMIKKNKLEIVGEKKPYHPYGKILKKTTISIEE